MHLRVRHLHALELAVVRGERLVRRVELRHAGRSGPPVEVRSREGVRVRTPGFGEKRELASEERGLVARRGEQARIAEPDAKPRGNSAQFEQLLVDHPAGPLADEQEP